MPDDFICQQERVLSLNLAMLPQLCNPESFQCMTINAPGQEKARLNIYNVYMHERVILCLK